MWTTLYDHNAKRRTVSVTLNADLVARSAAHGINISRVAEAALVVAFEQAEKISEATQYIDAYVAEHGHPFPESRAMFMPEEDDVVEPNDDAA